MKKSILTLLFLCSAFVLIEAQKSSQKNDPVGQWKFEAPSAPEEYTSGNMVIDLADKKYSASMSFTGIDYKFLGENVKVVKDSIFFSIYVESENVAIRLKTEDAAKMTGTATYSGGVVPLTLLKEDKGTGK